jgi:hypothetical protein
MLVAWFGLVVALADTAPRMASADEGPPPAARLPFTVSGTVLSVATKVAALVVLDEHGRPLGEVAAHEGDTIRGYRIERIEPHAVTVDRDGKAFTIPVGNPRLAGGDDEARPAVAIPHRRTKPIVGTFVAPPDNIGEIRQQTGAMLQRLREHPELSPLFEQRERPPLEHRDTTPSGFRR